MTEEQRSEMYQNAIKQMGAMLDGGCYDPMGLANCAPRVRAVDIGTWWSPREDIRASFSMRVVSKDGGKVQLEAPLWNGHCLSWETTEADLLERWVEVE